MMSSLLSWAGILGWRHHHRAPGCCGASERAGDHGRVVVSPPRLEPFAVRFGGTGGAYAAATTPVATASNGITIKVEGTALMGSVSVAVNGRAKPATLLTPGPKRLSRAGNGAEQG